MKKEEAFPLVSVVLALSTLVASFTVAALVNGSPWSVVRILVLRDYGGVDNALLARGEWWRLLTAQFVHDRPAHMLFNVITLFLVGLVIAIGLVPQPASDDRQIHSSSIEN